MSQSAKRPAVRGADHAVVGGEPPGDLPSLAVPTATVGRVEVGVETALSGPRGTGPIWGVPAVVTRCCDLRLWKQVLLESMGGQPHSGAVDTHGVLSVTAE